VFLNSVEAIYCAGYLPYKFLSTSETFVYIPEFLNAFIMLGINIWTLLLSEFVRKRSIELSFHANTLGDWTKCYSVRPNVEEWSPEKNYNKGDIVTFKGNTWKAVGIINSAEPGKYETYFLYTIFEDPIGTYVKMIMWMGFVIILSLGFILNHPFSYSFAIGFISHIYVLVRTIHLSDQIYLTK
jgi:hypothetical protein